MARTFVWHRTRGPKSTPKEQPAGKGKLEIRQLRSAIGHPEKLKLTLAAIGLRHHQHVIVKQDSPSLRGQLKRVRHLVQVTPIKG